MGIVPENNGVSRLLVSYDLVFGRLVFCGIIAVVDEEVYWGG
jgi:hypothetical protein